MESFFLAETTKYLYLLFDPDHYLNNNGGIGTLINTPNGECVIDAGGYIFNTEAHPIDPSALRCCYDMPRQQLLSQDYDREKYLGDIVRFNLDVDAQEKVPATATFDVDIDSIEIVTEEDSDSLESQLSRLTNLSAFNVNQLLNTDEAKNELLKFLNEMKSTPIKNITMGESLLDSAYDDLIVREHVNSSETIAKTVVNQTTNEKKSEAMASPAEANQTGASGTLTESKASDNMGLGEIKEPIVKEATVEKVTEFFRPETTKKREPFDAQKFLERIRTIYNDKNITRNYELLSCKAQSFSQRLAVLGEILTWTAFEPIRIPNCK